MSEMSKKTKTYKAIVKIFKYNFFSPDHIMIGILNGNNSSKTNLNMIIKKLSNNFYLSNMPKEYLVIPTLSVLRRNVEEVKKYLELIIDNRIAILILYNLKYSSCGCDFNKFTKSSVEMKKSLNNISTKNMVNKQGRDRIDNLNNSFKKIISVL